MKIRCYLDPVTEEPHIYNHDVDEGEVENVLLNPGEDRSGREGSRVAIGQTFSSLSSETAQARTRMKNEKK